MWIIIDILIVILLFYLINKWLKIITITPYKKLYQVEVRENNLVYRIGAKKAYTGYVVQIIRMEKLWYKKNLKKVLKMSNNCIFMKMEKFKE